MNLTLFRCNQMQVCLFQIRHYKIDLKKIDASNIANAVYSAPKIVNMFSKVSVAIAA